MKTWQEVEQYADLHAVSINFWRNERDWVSVVIGRREGDRAGIGWSLNGAIDAISIAVADYETKGDGLVKRGGVS